ncbi:hypothetical protein G7Y89_g15705 [Cudoniella acicularis]|uniref:Postreplication repair E3 ubiquitin-protein ligase RAD18 n=1 Tax=Cudoniella acicularis TaxID=354080 RepID=A0A8H4QFY4_9HELO|nr:hypothetical protein G7Y89_g15705 [Cudoniella acicularis]
MGNRAHKDDAFDITDSTDWLDTPLKSLAQFDSALRCQVYNDGKCPACRAGDQATKLRNNWAVENLVETFKQARPEVFEFAKKSVEVVREPSPKRSRKAPELLEGEEDEELPARKRTRSSRSTRATTQERERSIVLDTDEGDSDFTPDAEARPLETGLVECPICCKYVKEDKINAHLDRNCQDEPQKVGKAQARSTSFSAMPTSKPIKRLERLPQLHYSMVKEAALRKKLSDQGLPAWGTRQALEKRYSEWVTLWNANCDATNPKGKVELRRELDTWERHQGAQAQGSSSSMVGALIKDKDFDKEAYASQHVDSFKDLIALARAKIPAKPKPAIPEPSLDASEMATNSTPQYQSPHIGQPSSDTKMGEAEDSIGVLPTDPEMDNTSTLPARASGSQRRFFDDTDISGSSLANSVLPPSSQYSNEMPVYDKEAGSISSDISTMANLQS